MNKGAMGMLEGFAFPVKVIRTARKKSVGIYLDGGLVTVRAPMFLSERRVRALLVKQTPWIEKKRNEQSARIPPKKYVDGEVFAYLGRNYRLRVTNGDTPCLRLKGGCLVATIRATDTPETIRCLLHDWYHGHAHRHLVAKTERLAKRVGVTPQSVSVKNYKSRWGSCSVNGDITYNWHLILAPHRIIDYVVIHELCHILEHNHSPRYWAHVARLVPAWKECRNWLKQFPIVV